MLEPLASEHQSSLHLCLPSPGIRNVCCCHRLFLHHISAGDPDSGPLVYTASNVSSTGPSLQLLSQPFNTDLVVHTCVLCVHVHVYTCHDAIWRPEDNSGELILSFHFVEPGVSCFCCFTVWLAGLWASRWFCFHLPSRHRGAVVAGA